MSRIPRFQEHLKTAFTAEAASAARFRADAAKDALAVEMLEAAEQVRGLDADLGNAVSEERYENDVLYPKMIRDVDQETANVFLRVVNAQKEHLRLLETLRADLNAAQGDVALPPEVDRGTAPSAPES